MKGLLATIALLALASCARRPNAVVMAPPPDSLEVLEKYELYVKGDYAAYVKEMQSCDGRPQTYIDQMVLLLRQHAEEQKKEYGDIVDVKIARIELNAPKAYANAFLEISHSGQPAEQIVLPLVYVDGRWRLK